MKSFDIHISFHLQFPYICNAPPSGRSAVAQGLFQHPVKLELLGLPNAANDIRFFVADYSGFSCVGVENVACQIRFYRKN